MSEESFSFPRLTDEAIIETRAGFVNEMQRKMGVITAPITFRYLLGLRGQEVRAFEEEDGWVVLFSFLLGCCMRSY